MIDIYKFCADGDYRGYLHHPHKLDGLIFASNGHILVAANLPESAIDIPDGAEVLPEQVTSSFRQIIAGVPDSPDAWLPAAEMQTEASEKSCDSCAGSGRELTEAECPDCYGEGQFMRGRHEYECQGCDGDGTVVGPPGTADCSECSGTGNRPGFWRLPWRPTNAVYGRYVRLIQELPGAEIAQHGEEKDPIHFRFAGGRGAVIPLIVDAPSTPSAER